MKKLKAIRKQLRKNNQWKEYKAKYEHIQMRLILSKTALIWNPKADVDVLYQKEVEFLNAKKEDQIEMFVKAFQDFREVANSKTALWDEYARYLWFVYQTSTYWRDIRKNVQNIFNKNNYIEMNQIKRRYYNNWVESIDLSVDGVNDKVIRIQKEIF